MSLTLYHQVAAKYIIHPDAIFIETGSYVGDCIQTALDVGYKKVLSVEFNTELARNCAIRYKSNSNVSIFCGDSADVLAKEILPNLQSPATFWLDAHAFERLASPNIHHYPIFRELEAIGNHFFKTHTIMIDDRRVWWSEWNIKEQDIVKKIMAINPQFQVHWENNKEAADDILVACVTQSPGTVGT